MTAWGTRKGARKEEGSAKLPCTLPEFPGGSWNARGFGLVQLFKAAEEIP